MTALITPPVQPPAPNPPPRTAEEFAERYAGQRAEFLFGKVVFPPMPFQQHRKMCFNAAYLLGTHVVPNDLGHITTNDSFVKVPMRDDPEKVRGADVCYFSYERVPKGDFPGGLLDISPDLIVEVKSPSDTWTLVFTKVGEYLTNGVRVVVVIDVDSRSASVYRPTERQQIVEQNETLTLPDVLPGFAVPVANFFV
jgi:Uma2 family endonuclease